MIQSLQLDHFRGFVSLRLKDLALANLIIGGNNSGRTSLLEALVLLFGDRRQLSELPSTFRAQSAPSSSNDATYWRWLPRQAQPEGFRATTGDWSVSLEPQDDGAWLLSRYSSPPSPHAFHTTARINSSSTLIGDAASPLRLAILPNALRDPTIVSSLFAEVAPPDSPRRDALTLFLRKAVEPRLLSLDLAQPPGHPHPLIFAGLEGQASLPYTQLGLAFARSLHLYLELYASQPQLLLVDEIEYGLYHDAISRYWEHLLPLLNSLQIQLFATTHSRECLESAHRAGCALDASYPLRYLRLDRRIDEPDRIVATSFGQRTMQRAIDEDWEMR
jgi:hypothetical protein